MSILRPRGRRPSQASERHKTEQVQRELERVRRQWPTVLQYAAILRIHHDRNHFAESLTTIFRGGTQ